MEIDLAHPFYVTLVQSNLGFQLNLYISLVSITGLSVDYRTILAHFIQLTGIERYLSIYILIK